jgi:signal transduction histidine kinase
MSIRSDLPFALEHAGWPAFLVDNSGIIRQTNEAAVTVLGTVMRGESALSASIWSPENGQTAEEFLARTERKGAPPNSLKFRTKGGGTATFNTFVCPVMRGGQKSFLFQLLPESGAAGRAATAPAGKPATDPKPGPPAAPAAPAVSDTAQKQKLDCALQLTRTVALDFNNALTTILGHTSLVLSRMPPEHPWRPSLLEVEKSAEHAAEIAHDLAEFSRPEKETQAHAPGNLNTVLRHAVELFQKTQASRVLWTLQLEKRVFMVNFDEAKLHQAFVKVLENAVEAVSREGRITVRTLNHSFTDAVISPTIQLPAGNYVCVEVNDNGSGIPADVLPRIFEPFFSTKGPPHRGLGLAWVYGILTNHGGTIVVTSPPGQGTTVRMFLPAQKKVVRDQATRAEDLRGTETVLFVDDEEMLLNLGQMILSSFGYKVVTANNGARALDLFAQATSQIDLVITDLVMPGMSGRELIDQLRRVSPTVPILSTSGYVRSTTDEDEENYLRKPFTADQLLRKVKQVLGQNEPH